MKKLSFIIAVVAMLGLTSCGSHTSQAFYPAPSQLLSTNYDGTIVVRTQVRARNYAKAFEDAQRKAVEEVIFDGIKSTAEGLNEIKPLCFVMNAREKFETYFQAFFQDKGEWTKYASLKDKRSFTSTYYRDGRQTVQTVTVTVDRAGLQKKLREDGIIPKEGRY